MDTRRDFIRKAAMLAGGTGLWNSLPPSIQKALAIDPKPGSTWLDAEHVVLLMQENRSFDHCYGALRGVRGFNDPRAITLPGKNSVWLQTNAAGETYAPFRLDMKESKATWVGSLPHSWTNQVDAGNGGKHDQWLEAKRSGNKEIADMPWTMGYYEREDLPFYYALADAFTVCDQNFCSSLTGTTPNRLFFWTGTVRSEMSGNVRANVRNEDVDYPTPASWTTFPERLEENGISWKIYQNEISLDSGFEGEEDSWLSNFTDNPIEWFTQYHVKFSESYQRYLQKLSSTLPADISSLETRLASPGLTDTDKQKIQKELAEKKSWLPIVAEDLKTYTRENFDKLPEKEKNLHRKAFTINSKDPHYRQLETYQYQDGGLERHLQAPKGDVLHQFREDVENGQLPTVSWLVAPENFSDHPTSPWYGAWYLSEAMDILTKNPEVWKKTIFILAYDENDGIFDHVPPFSPPYQPGTGAVSGGIDLAVEHVSMKEELAHKPAHEARESVVGLGYRVPLVIASPWSRGGFVNSEVFDHTSSLQFLEKFINAKFSKKIEETNISAWRRMICGDLTSVFRPWNGEKIDLLPFSKRKEVLETIHKAQFQKLPVTRRLSAEEIAGINRNPAGSPLMAAQEKGIRPSCALPYQLYADGHFDRDKKAFSISFGAKTELFGKNATGAPFKVYAPGKYTARDKAKHPSGLEECRSWSYAVAAGDQIGDAWPLTDFADGYYHLRVYGPNGFFREFLGNEDDPLLDIRCEYQHVPAHVPAGKTDLKGGGGIGAGGFIATGKIELQFRNLDAARTQTLEIKDNAYKSATKTVKLGKAGAADAHASLVIDLAHSHHWYDLSVLAGKTGGFEKRYAGRVETGKHGFSDPLMGRV